MKKVFDTFNSPISTKYVYAPRIYRSLCKLHFIYEDDLKKILPLIVCKDHSLNKMYNEAIKSKSFDPTIFFDNNKKKIEQIASENSNYYSTYLLNIISENADSQISENADSQISENADSQIAIVDDVANTFSAQYLLETFLNKKVFGFYFSVINKEKEFTKYKYKSYSNSFYKEMTSGSESHIFSSKWNFIEFLFGAPSAPVCDIDKNGIVCKKSISKEESFRIYVNDFTSSYAENFARDIKELFGGFDCFFEYPVIISWINSFLNFPFKEDYKFLKEIYWDRTTTNSTLIPLLVTPSSIISFFFNIYNMKKISGPLYMWPSNNLGVIYKSKKNEYDLSESIRIFGYPVLRKLFRGSYYSENPNSFISFFGGNLITKEENLGFISYKILGKEVYKKRNLTGYQKSNPNLVETKIINTISENMGFMISTLNIHKRSFSKYKNLHKGQTVVLFGGGPSSKFFKPFDKAIYVGVNRVFLNKNIKFDYLFASELSGLVSSTVEFINEFLSYEAIKFVGYKKSTRKIHIPEGSLNNFENINRYNTTYGVIPDKFALDLTSEPLGDFCSIAIQAMQFILYTNPKTVYLVGFDCTSKSPLPKAPLQFVNTKFIKNADDLAIFNWKKLKSFIDDFYPDTKVISINPIGLRGIFEDEYSAQFVTSNCDLLPTEVNIKKKFTCSNDGASSL